MKYILVTGGVISGVGKGVIASSAGLLLKTRGFRVTSIKIDPYLNIDAGTLSPLDHGEVFVLDDGGEVDLDLGCYERFLDVTLTREHNITTGKIYKDVIEGERRGDYLGRTVQVVPHITDAIQNWIERVAVVAVDETKLQPDVCVIEMGGTVGDIESASFIEAMRQFQFRVGSENFFLIHVSLVPTIGSVGEQKTKPTQQSIQHLRGAGLSPDVIICRSTKKLDESVSQKIAMFCHVLPEDVLAVHDCPSVYHVPVLLDSQYLPEIMMKRLGLTSQTNPGSTVLFTRWKELVIRYDLPYRVIKIAIVGKYTRLHDSYISVVKALEHVVLSSKLKLQILWIEAESLESPQNDAWSDLHQADGVLVPGGFGIRGWEGMIKAVEFARREHKPYLGICLGFQAAIVEFARNEMKLPDANSTEMDSSTTNPIVIFMPDGSRSYMGATMRLGSHPVIFRGEDETLIRRLYGGEKVVYERHRHRYEVNPKYVSQIEAKGLKFVATDSNCERMEIVENPGCEFFVAVQFHPEYKTRPLVPVPVFRGFVLAAAGLLRFFNK